MKNSREPRPEVEESQNRSLSREQIYLRWVLSLWILFHLSVMVIMANPSSYLVRLWGPALSVYANPLGLHSSWNFFSPDPAHVMYFNYTLTLPPSSTAGSSSTFQNEENAGDSSSEETSEVFSIPPRMERGPFGLVERRLVYAMRYMVLDRRRTEKFLGPWLCRRHPEAESIHIVHEINSIPGLDQSTQYPEGEVMDRSQEIKLVDTRIRCGALDEVSP